MTRREVEGVTPCGRARGPKDSLGEAIDEDVAQLQERLWYFRD